MSSELPKDAPAPRLCHLVKWPDFDGYGFNLHAEKAKTGQFIGKVDEGSPAELANLREGDRIIEVNGVNISNENHRQVVERIKALFNETKLLVIDEEGDRYYKDRKLVVKGTQSNVIYTKTPPTRISKAEEVTKNGDKDSDAVVVLPSETKKSSSPKKSPEKVSAPENNNTVNGNHAPTPTKEPESPPKKRPDSPEPVSKTKSEAPKKPSKADSPKPVSRPVADSPKQPTTKSNSSAKTTSEAPKTAKTTSETTKTEAKTNGSAANGSSANGTSANGSSKPVNGTQNGPASGGDLNLLNMSAAEMREMLATRKKRDPRNQSLDMREKYQIVQQM